MNAAERERIAELLAEGGPSRRVRSRSSLVFVWAIIPVILVTCAIHTHPHIPTLTSWAAIALLAYLYLTIISRRMNRQNRQKHEEWRRDVYLPQWREALEDGNVAVERIEPTEVIEVVMGYPVRVAYAICAIAEDQVICRSGGNDIFAPNCLCGPQASKWPNACFEVIRTIRHDLALGTFCYGEKKEPIRAYEREHWSIEVADMTEIGAVLIGTPQSVVDQAKATWEEGR
ncbi:hypothetical protein [Capsulimonas corticalis]|nr:hypothetical protein [Capsulimonas corticalis]